MSERSDMYRMARLLGDWNAAKRGPAALGRRVVRRRVYGHVNRTTGRVLRSLGLGR